MWKPTFQGSTARPLITPPLPRLLLAVSFGAAVVLRVRNRLDSNVVFVLGSATHSFELMLSAFIFGLALGSFIVRRRGSGDDKALRRLAHVQLAMGALAVATLPVYAQSFDWMADFTGGFTAQQATSDTASLGTSSASPSCFRRRSAPA